MSKINVNAEVKCVRPFGPLFLATLFALCLSAGQRAQADGSAAQESFDTPQAAANALVTAIEADDMSALRSILGTGAERILSSGDPVADKNARGNLAVKYREMHRIAYDDRGRVTLYIGADNWPLPIPLIKRVRSWAFDTASGEAELLYRRIGRNELYTIGVLKELARAQREYANEIRNGETTKVFAQKIVSDPGTQNGLYWAAASGEPESPTGPLIAAAVEEGYKKGSNGSPIPFHGYYYRVLTRQGIHAPGGAKNYRLSGKMTRGFAFLAVPAEYRSSGVTTFMINQDGVVVQKDLGPNTSHIASEMDAFNPDKSWDQVIE